MKVLSSQILPIWVPWRAGVNDATGEMVCIVERDVSLRKWGMNGFIPRGFRSDGMSIPRFFWRWISPKIDARTVAPSIIHDWLYTSHLVTRAEADAWFREALWANGMSRMKANVVWLGVRLFGSSHWASAAGC